MRWIRALASLKITVTLLIAILVILSAGTIVESRSGREAAAGVYYAWWFQAILAFYGLHLLCALVDKWPWGRQRIGFATTHISMILILAGAGISHWFTVDGRLALWEGETSSEFRTGDRGEVVVPLSFSVRLDSFEIDTYPGTMRPAMFRSRVTVEDPRAGEPFPAVIEMNRELSWGGWKFFQSSYLQEDGREMTILSVSRDPGQILVFVGYGLLVLGMCIVLGTRIVQRRAVERARAARGPGGRAFGAIRAGALPPLVALGLALGAGSVRAEPMPGVPDPETVAALRALPVQHDGRTMPLDTMARETVRVVTGTERWRGEDPVGVVLAWSFAPEAWENRQLVRIGGPELRAALGLPADLEHVSYGLLVARPALFDVLRQARAAQDAERPLFPAQEDALELEGRLVRLQRFLRGEAIRTEPVPDDPSALWGVASGVGSPQDLVAHMRQLRASPPVADYPSAADIDRELAYHRVNPPRLAWWILVPTCLFALLAWQREDKRLDVLASGGLLAGFVVMSWGIATRWQFAGRIPASNMYESLLFLGWGVGLFALVAAVLLRNRLVILNAAAMSTLTMILVDRLPIDPFVHPMPPVLSGTPWLAIHVPIIMVSYSVLALGVVLAHMQIGIAIFAPRRHDLATRMNDLLYWYIQVGSILLIAGILTGSIWAASSWGRYWGWDPKEVWSLVAFLAYMAILHARVDRVLGPYGVAAASILAFQTILMTYLGVNYVLATGLHSYGFGGGAVVRWMVIVALAEVAFLAAGWVAHLRAGSRRST